MGFTLIIKFIAFLTIFINILSSIFLKNYGSIIVLTSNDQTITIDLKGGWIHMTNVDQSKDTPEASPLFDGRDFRNALGNFGTGVTVITTIDQESRPYGVTVSSFNSVSLDPPLILWSQVRSAPSHQAFVEAPVFVVNILAESQKDLSNHFAKPSEDKFKGIAHYLSPQGIPILEGTLGHFVCAKEREVDGGDHLIFIGRVLSYSYNTSEHAAPLFFWKGKYHSAADHVT
jgi:flavin reductase (DIM6/NTAB) family NADH-FMN oxidoreductase RutF